MALSNAERQRRWLAKNRALHNFRRRKKNLPVPVLAEPLPVGRDRMSDPNGGEARESTKVPPVGVSGQDSRGGQNPTITALKALLAEEVKEPVADSRKPQVFRNDYGAVISEEAFMELLRRKAQAEKKGYEIDEYSQT